MEKFVDLQERGVQGMIQKAFSRCIYDALYGLRFSLFPFMLRCAAACETVAP